MPESYPSPAGRSSPAPLELSPPPRRRFQFSLAWLLFWTTVCAILAGFARMLLARGDKGYELLVTFAAVGVWLTITWIALWYRIFALHRWKRADAKRREMENLVRSRRKAIQDAAEEEKRQTNLARISTKRLDGHDAQPSGPGERIIDRDGLPPHPA